MLWQNGANVFKDDLKSSALTSPEAVEAADLFGSFFTREKVSPPLGGNPRDAFVGGKLAMWIGGSWNFTGLKDVPFESDFVATPQMLKKAVAWTGPHQFTFPKSKSRDAAKTDAIWSWLQWITEHTPDWTIGAGQLPATKRKQQDPKLAGLPIVKVLDAQSTNWQLGQASTKWPKAETLSLPVMESVYLGQRSAQDAMADLAKQLDSINA
jgi:ABC-type glycerol-3-phosphate transport system substrate-binding protein